MEGSSKTVKLGLISLIVVIAILLVAMILGAIDSEQLKTTAGKTGLIVGIVVIAFIGISAVAGKAKK